MVFFSVQIPREYDFIGAHGIPTDTGYYWLDSDWILKVDPEVFHTIVVPRLSEIILTLKPKGPTLPDTVYATYTVTMEYDYLLSRYDNMNYWVKHEEFNVDSIVTAGRSIWMPRDQESYYTSPNRIMRSVPRIRCS